MNHYKEIDDKIKYINKNIICSICQNRGHSFEECVARYQDLNKYCSRCHRSDHFYINCNHKRYLNNKKIIKCTIL